MGEHAKLSASASHRWMICGPSAELESRFPETTSIYAEEGTHGHLIAEWKLHKFLGLKAGRKPKNTDFDSPELEDAVDNYVIFAIEKINEAKVRSKDATVLIEQRVDFSKWVQEGFGTCDLLTVSDGMLEIMDLKMGRGVPVSAEHNFQLMIYALGAIELFDDLYEIETVRVNICQPRLNEELSSWVISKKELLEWAENDLRPKAEKAYKGEGEFVAGSHCRFCRAKATCRARAEANLELARFDFADAELLSDEEIGEILSRAEELQNWVGDIKEHAFQNALKGYKYNGWKLVAGRANRKFTDEDAVAEILIESGYTEDKIYSKTLIGITSMEKMLGKKKFIELLGNLVYKPKGSPVLVPENDKRSIWNSAGDDFDEWKGDEE